MFYIHEQGKVGGGMHLACSIRILVCLHCKELGVYDIVKLIVYFIIHACISTYIESLKHDIDVASIKYTLFICFSHHISTRVLNECMNNCALM